MTDADVIVVGAGPTGLMLASELRLAGVRTLVLERHPHVQDVAKAGGLNGQILDIVRHRALLGPLEAAAVAPRPGSRFPWGGIHVDLTLLDVPPMEALPLPQPDLERLLERHVIDQGGEVRRSHRVVGLHQDDESVTVAVDGPEGPGDLTARYVVGCDGGRSRVRDLAGIGFPGTSYPETERMGTVARHGSLAVLEDGSLEVPGFGTIPFGYTATEHGVFAFAARGPDALGFYTSEDDAAEQDEDEPMTTAELRASIRRVLGADIPMESAVRLTRFTYHARHADHYRDRRAFLAGDAAHLFPAGGVAINAGMVDAVNLAWKLAAAVQGWAPDDLLDSYEDERRRTALRTLLHTKAQVALRRGHDEEADALRSLLQELLQDAPALRRLGALMAASDPRYPQGGPGDHPLTGLLAPDLVVHTDDGVFDLSSLLHGARPLLLELADRPDLREVALGWRDRVDLLTAGTESRPADAILIRPDVRVAWAAVVDEPGATATEGLRDALRRWFGEPIGA